MKRYFITVITVLVLVCNVVLADGIPVREVGYSFESDAAVGESLYETELSLDGYAMGTKLTYTVSDGKESVNADVTIRSENSQEKNAVLIFKALNSNGRFYLTTTPVTIAANGDTSAKVSLNGLENAADGYRLSLYLWDAFNTLKPLTKSLTILQNSDSMVDVSVSVRTGAALSQVKLLDTLVAAVSTNTKTAYQWQISRDDGASWTDINGETSAEHIVSAAEAGAKVRCAVTEDGYMYAASAAVQIPDYEVNATGNGIAVPDKTADTTPDTDKFTVDGRGFVLLDTFDNDESTYYVTTTDAYGDLNVLTTGDFENPTGKQINYDSYKSDAFLNGEFLTNGNNFTALGNDTETYYKLPRGIVDNINKNHVWTRFVNDTRFGEGVQREYTTGVSLLSWTDFTTYAGKLGVMDVFNDVNTKDANVYFLRDTNNWGNDNALALFGGAKYEKKCLHIGWYVEEYGLLRPAFYLKKDFFKSTRLDLDATGENVRTAIRNACTDEELFMLYNSEECKTYFNIESSIKVTTAVRSGAELANVKLLDTLTASVSEGVATEYKWQTRTGEGDKWTEIEGATSNEYIVSAAQAGKQVSCAAKVNGMWIYSKAVQIPMYEAAKTGDGAAVPEGTIDTTADSDKFTVDGKEFVLLDTFDNDESTYYVTTTDAYGDMQLKTDGEWWTLSGKEINYDAHNVTGFLNVDFLTNGNNFTALGNDTTTYYKLPQGIIDNINKNHVWWRFVNDYRKENGVESTYQAGVSFLSWTDFTTYAGKLGIKDGCLNSNVANADTYFLRDTNSWGGDTSLALFYTTDKQCKHWGQYNRSYGLVRPAFYLKKDFFKTTKIDLATMGGNVRTAIREACTDEELKKLYTEEECEDYFGIVRPLSVKTAVRSGKLLENVELLDTLTASLNKNVAADYRWQVSRNNGASWADIADATSTEYIVSAAEAGALVRCTATVAGNSVSGEAVRIPNPAIKTPETVYLDAFAEKAPNEFRFEVDGKTFVLLDTFDNDESAYYVTTADAYGDMQTITNGAIPVGKKINYDAYKSDTFLNGDFLTKGNNFTALGNDTTTYYKLPQGIIDNINKNHVWWRFVNDYRKQNGVQNTYKTGVSLLSWTDFSTYAERIGQLDAFEDANVKDADVMFLRDTNNWGGNSAVTVFGTGKYENKCIYVENQSKTPFGLLRPAFYLKKDFFRTVKLDLSQTGESVLDVMRGRYSIEDLTGIYTEQELTENGFRRRGETNGNTLKIESIAVGNVFTDAEDAKIRINSSSPAVSYRITDYDDKVVKSGTANTVYDFAELDFNSLDVGYYELSVQNGNTFDDSAEKKTTSFAIIPEYDFSQVTNSPFGINTHFELNWLGWDIKTISLLKKAGVKSVRDGYEWHSMESEVKGEYKNYYFFPYEQARLRQAGIDYLYVAGSYNKFYDNDASPYTDEGMQGLANYAKKAAELYNYKYGDYKLKYMEMYNEWYTAAGDKGDGPADSSPENYIKVFQKMYETVKTAYPNMTMFLNIYPQETNSEGLLKLGGLNYCDGYAIHHYNYSLNNEDPENPECGLGSVIDKTQNMVAKYNTDNKGMKFWLSEFGWPAVSAPDWGVLITEKEQAEYLVRGFAVALSKGMERVYWYDFMNDRDRNHKYEDDCESHKKNGEYNYGLIRNGFDRTYGAHTPKRSYVAYANITRELANKSFVRVDKADDGVGAVYHYHFEGAGGKTAIAYYAVLDGSEEKPSKSITLTANESVVVKNIEGKTLKIASAGEDITLELSSAPIYIEGGYTVKQ